MTKLFLLFLSVLFCMPINTKSTKTKTLTAESVFMETKNEAEDDCEDKLKSKTDKFIDDVEDDGGKIVSTQSIDASNFIKNSKGEFKCKCSRDIVYKLKDDKNSTEAHAIFVNNKNQTIQINEAPPGIKLEVEMEKRIFNYWQNRYKSISHHIVPQNISLKTKDYRISGITGYWTDEYKTLISGAEQEAKEAIYENCTSEMVNREQTFSLEETEEETITFTREIETEFGVNTNISIQGSIVGGSVGGNYSRRVKTTSGSEKVVKNVKTRSETFNINVPPYTILNYKLFQSQSKGQRKFKGRVYVTCGLRIEFKDGCNSHITSHQHFINMKERNNNNLKKVEELLDEKDLYFDIEGYVDVSTISNVKEKRYTTKCEQ